MKTFSVKVSYGVVTAYEKIVEVKAKNEDDALELASEMEHDITDGTWDSEEIEVDYSDLSFEIEE